MFKRILAAVISIVFVLISLPTTALYAKDTDHPTPHGFDENDYQKALAFMETTDENGVKNGDRIVSNFNGSYDPNYPDGWSYFYYDHENSIFYIYGLFFTDTVPRRLASLNLYNMGLAGELDVSDCIELSEITCDRNRLSKIDVSGCPELRMLLCSENEIAELNVEGCTGLDAFDCSDNRLTELDMSGCTSLRDIACDNNEIEELDITGCTQLNSILCNDNDLTELDVSVCTGLYWLDCSNNHIQELDISNIPSITLFNCANNRLTSLDLSRNSNLYFDSVSSNGPGFIGYEVVYDYTSNCDTLTAKPMYGKAFLGWYSSDGFLISQNDTITMNDTDAKNIIAEFGTPDSILGDVDGDGSITSMDALAVLRYTLSIIDGSGLAIYNGDMDHNGIINSTDALVILRISMGSTN